MNNMWTSRFCLVFLKVGHATLAEAAPAVLEEVIPTVSEIILSSEQARLEDRNEKVLLLIL